MNWIGYLLSFDQFRHSVGSRVCYVINPSTWSCKVTQFKTKTKQQWFEDIPYRKGMLIRPNMKSYDQDLLSTTKNVAHSWNIKRKKQVNSLFRYNNENTHCLLIEEVGLVYDYWNYCHTFCSNPTIIKHGKHAFGKAKG